jgi:hypothetical protein
MVMMECLPYRPLRNNANNPCYMTRQYTTVRPESQELQGEHHMPLRGQGNAGLEGPEPSYVELRH